MYPDYWDEACRYLSSVDKTLHKIINSYHKKVTLELKNTPFTTLMRTVVGQQISIKAADSIWLKIAAQTNTASPQQVVLDIVKISSCGLSKRKLEYVENVAHYFCQIDNSIEHWKSKKDEEIITELTSIKGIGRWSAEMFLIFALQRPNILPLDDLGLLRAIQLHYNLEEASKKKVKKICHKWQPWSTVATCYMWRSIDPHNVAY